MSYTYSVSQDTANGKVSVFELTKEIGNSSIVTALDYINVVGDSLIIVFKGDLSGPDVTTLNGLVAAHTAQDTTKVPTVKLIQAEGALDFKVDSVEISHADVSEWKRAEMQVPENLYLQGVFAVWKSAQLGDRIFLSVYNQASEGNLAVAAAQDDTVLNLGPSLAPLYDPAVGAKYIDFWKESESPRLHEVRKIVSRSGNEITIDSGLAAARDGSYTIRSIFGVFTQVRGSAGKDGGFRLLGDNSFTLFNLVGKTSLLSTALGFSVAMYIGAGAGTRELAVNFLFRAD